MLSSFSYSYSSSFSYLTSSSFSLLVFRILCRPSSSPSLAQNPACRSEAADYLKRFSLMLVRAPSLFRYHFCALSLPRARVHARFLSLATPFSLSLSLSLSLKHTFSLSLALSLSLSLSRSVSRSFFLSVYLSLSLPPPLLPALFRALIRPISRSLTGSPPFISLSLSSA